MPISLKNVVGGGTAVELGEVVWMQDQPELLIEIDGMSFLKSGNVLTNEETIYPEAFEKFGTQGDVGDTWVPTAVFPSWDMVVGIIVGVDGFIAAGNSGRIATSSDGITWAQQSNAPLIIRSLAFGNGLYIAAGNSGKLATSTDLVVWTQRDAGFGSTSINALAFGNGLYIAAGDGGKLATSPDGITWTQQIVIDGIRVYCVAYLNGVWVLGGEGSASSMSADGLAWAARTSTPINIIYSFLFSGSRWFIVGGTGQISYSDNLTEWSPVIQAASDLYQSKAAATLNGTFLVGSVGYLCGLSVPTALLGLPTEVTDGQSVQYMRVK